MPVENLTMKTRDGLEAEAHVEISRYNIASRLARSLPIFVTSVVVGLFSILIPAVHLISVWFIPLLGTGVAIYVFRIEAKLGLVKGTCPSCSSEFSEPGGPFENPLWLRCPHCASPLQIHLP